MASSREVTVRLNLKPIQAEVLQRVFGDLTANSRKSQEYIDQITKGLELQAQQATKLQVALNPDLLKERVRLTLEEQKARRDLDAAFRKEYEQQTLTPLGRTLTRSADLFTGGAASRVVGGAIQGYQQRSIEAGGGAFGAAAGLGGAISGIVGGFAAAGSALKSFVAVCNPASVLRFDRALADTTAVIGRALAPVLDVVTGALRLVGDMLASILPSGDAVREALQPLGELFDSLREALAPVAEIFRDVFLVALKALSVPLRLFADLIKGIVHVLEDIGLLDRNQKLQSSVGAAVRHAQFTSPEQAAKSIYAAILQSSAPPGSKPTSTPAWLEKIFGAIEKIYDFLTFKWGGGLLGNVPSGAASAAVGLLQANEANKWLLNKLVPSPQQAPPLRQTPEQLRQAGFAPEGASAFFRTLFQQAPAARLALPAPAAPPQPNPAIQQQAALPRLEVPQSGRPFDARVGLQRHFFPEEFSNPDLARRSDALLEQAQKLARAGNPELAQRILNTPQSAAPGTAPVSLVRDMEQAFERALRRVHQDPQDRGRQVVREERGP